MPTKMSASRIEIVEFAVMPASSSPVPPAMIAGELAVTTALLQYGESRGANKPRRIKDAIWATVHQSHTFPMGVCCGAPNTWAISKRNSQAQ